ncbi:MAG: hypothetical protein PHR16_14095 [Methylovulum sp.]|nr:hypothetical protein [Methylovulum sp.]
MTVSHSSDPIGRLIPPGQPAVFSARGCFSGAQRNAVIEIDGDGTIGDNVYEGLTPVVRKVWLLDKRNLSVVRTTVSAQDGSYAFTGLNKSLKFCAISFDPNLVYNDASADNLTPE